MAMLVLLVGTATLREARPPVRTATKPNIVFILTDDLSWDLVDPRFTPHLAALQRRGETFDHYFVDDSLCCPSRASIFTGEFPHDTGVFTNTAPNGGFKQFLHRRDQTATFNVALAHAGYRTAMMGKYLNGYHTDRRYLGSRRYVPPGWTEWDVAGDAYREFGYRMNEDGVVVKYGHEPSDYLTTVLTARANAFIAACAARHAPFFLEVATFAPHAP